MGLYRNLSDRKGLYYINAWSEFTKGDKYMAEPIRLGLLIEDPEDVREFEDNMRNPKVTKEQVEFVREAIRVYKAHPF